MEHINIKQMQKPKKALISCGIFKNEITSLIEKNNWEVKPVFLNSSLHVDFDKLWLTLTKSIENHKDYEKIVCYGTCHPLMGKLMNTTQSVRTDAQNCVELILGREKFDEEIEQGAFFLFEDWATNWTTVTKPTFGDDPDLLKELFSSEHKYLLAIKTSCSNDFSEEANEISEIIGLPLKWITTDLKFLEEKLSALITL